MRNLKKLLALVLAMAMTLSLMLTVSAADVKFEDYGDKDSITAEFKEAVQVLTGLKVFQGDEKGFRPGDDITRAEAAAIVYRLATGDVNNRQNDLYKDYGTFTDVKSDDWFAGYVGYCQNAGYIKGTSPTTFEPYGKVTGYEALAMILRVVGYGKNNEFTGSTWQVNVAALSRQLGVTKHVTAAHMEETLNMKAPREVVADLLFMCAATVPTVTFTPALAYNDKQAILGNTIYNPTLGQQTFGLWYETNWSQKGDWARPGYSWYKNGTDTGALTDPLNGKAYAVKPNHPMYRGVTAGNLVATIYATPDYDTEHVQVRECDVAHALDIDDEAYFQLYVNGANTTKNLALLSNSNTYNNARGAVSDDYKIVATDTVTKVGGQGRVAEFYYKLQNKSEWFEQNNTNGSRSSWSVPFTYSPTGLTNDLNVAVMIDTVLAQVTNKTNAKLDPAGHVIVPATLEVTIWDGFNAGARAITTPAGSANYRSTQTASNRIITKASNDADNWDDYSKGDFILLNAYTNKDWRLASANDNDEDSAAFEVDEVLGADTNATTMTLEIEDTVWIADNGNKGIAKSEQGKQTMTYWNQNKHQMNGTDYDDQLTLFMDKAANTTNTTFTWYFDQYGNLIGIGDAHARTFGVITSIYAGISQSSDNTDTTGGIKAFATVKFSDGTTDTVEIDRFMIPVAADDDDTEVNDNLTVNGVSGISEIPAAAPGTTDVYDYYLNSNAYPAAPGTAYGDGTENTYAIPAGTAISETNVAVSDQRPVYDTTTQAAMSSSIANPTFTTATYADIPARVFIAPSSTTNTNAHFATGAAHSDPFGILYNNMFRFSVANDNAVVATVVAGDYDTVGANTAAQSNIWFQGLSNALVDTNGGTLTSKLYKNLGYIDIITDDNDAGASSLDRTYVYLTNDTEIMIKMGNNGQARTINTYKLADLNGDVTIPDGTEVDWADVDGDGRADYVYIANGSNPGTITYGLFYYNGGNAQWDPATGTGTIQGYLAGEENTLTTKSRTVFNAIQGSSTYQAHLFAVQFIDGAATAVLQSTYTSPGAAAAVSTNGQILTSTSGTVVAAPFNGGNPVVAADATLSTSFSAPSAADGTNFEVGTLFGNNYTTTTQAVYYHDTNSTTTLATDAIVSWNRVSNGDQIVVTSQADAGAPAGAIGSVTYWLAPNYKIVGELSWLNISTLECYVTMVYDAANANAVTEIYISHDPDVTPVPNTPVVPPTGPTPESTGYCAYYTATADTTGLSGWSSPRLQNGVSSYSLSNLPLTSAVEVPIELSPTDVLARLNVSTTANAAGQFVARTAHGETTVYTDLYATAREAVDAAQIPLNFVNVANALTINTGRSGYFVARNWDSAAGQYEYVLIHVVVTAMTT